MIVDASVCEKLAEIIQNLFRGPIFRTWSSAPKPFAAQVHALMLIGICISLCIRLSRQDAGGGGAVQPSPAPLPTTGELCNYRYSRNHQLILEQRDGLFCFHFLFIVFLRQNNIVTMQNVPIRFRLFRSLAI